MNRDHPSLAVVIPTLDEEAALRRNLPRVVPHADEVVVADGGSTDGTLAVARELGARIVCGPAGRGGQLTRGARATDASVLLFLHADTVLPDDAFAQVRGAIAQGASGGGFRVRFDSDRALLRFGSRLVNLRTRLFHLPLGDQAQFVARAVFDELGGFRDWPILEDLDFARRLRRRGSTVVLPGPALTATRRFDEQGVVRTVATNWLIWSLFFAGVSPRRLARLSRHVR
ncbi:MAG TPA: TIGR04283 family arsenosugar biosynthesis glycosyltransferase [Thermoanaerobaculia bacterium]